MGTLGVVAAGAMVGILAWSRLLPGKVLTGSSPRDADAGDEGTESLGAVRERARRPTVSVVIPALNEAKNIGWVLGKLPHWVDEVILVDGLSTDATESVAREAMPDLVVVHQQRPGKGAALRAGFAAAKCDIIVMLDADGSTDPGEMDLFVDALKDGAEFVKGSRHLSGGGSKDWTRIRRAGNKAFVRIVNTIFGSEFTDLCYGYCAFWRSELDRLALTADGFEIETQLVLNAVKAGLEIAEVPSMELERLTGVSNLNAWRDGKRVLRTIMEERPGQDSRGDAGRTRIDLVAVPMIIPSAGDHPRQGEASRPVIVYRVVEPQAALAGIV